MEPKSPLDDNRQESAGPQVIAPVISSASTEGQPLTIPSSLGVQAAPDPVPINHPRHLSLSKKKDFAVFLIVLCILAASFSVYQNSRANSLLKFAQSQISNGNFQSGLQLLDKAESYFSFGGTKAKIKGLINNDKRWVADNNYLQTAQSLVKNGKYKDASEILSKIDKDFPGYSKVTLLLKSIALKNVSSASSPVNKAAAGSGPKRFTSTAAISSLASATSISQAEHALQSFASQYNITVEITSVNPSNYVKTYDTFSKLSSSDLAPLKAYGELFIDEWAKYPKDWVAHSQLEDLIFVKNFDVGGDHRAAGPDPAGEAMYYDVDFSGNYAREVIHHEYDHLIEFNTFGSFSNDDPAWLSYNPPSFRYGNGGASCYHPNNTCLSGEHPIPGFVTGYAASAIAEDKAELYAYLMEATYYHHLKSWLSEDPYLSKKVAAYKHFIATYSPEMSGSYFDSINP